MTADWWLGRWSGTVSAWLALLICGGIAALAWFGYRAADEWQRSAQGHRNASQQDQPGTTIVRAENEGYDGQ